MRELHLAGNVLTSLPLSVGDLSQLRVLRVPHNQVPKEAASCCLCARFGCTVFADVACAADFQLMLLPPEIGRLSNLEEIDLRSNILSVLPDEFCQLRQLERAVLSHAFLPSRNQLPYCFGELTSLSSLEAANAGLFLVSDDQGNDYPDLSRLPLVNIDLSHNRLGPDLPSWLNANRTTAPLLRSLNLADNVSARPLAFSALHAVKVAVSCA